MEKIKSLLNIWSRRKLTIFGKITIIKQLAIPKILYPASVLSVPEGFVDKIKKLFYSFIWGNKEHVKRSILNNSVDKGGVKMVDIEVLLNAVKAVWVYRLIKSTPQDLWSIIPNNIFGFRKNNSLLLKLNFTDNRDIRHIFPLMSSFYKDILCAYNKSKCISFELFCKDIWNQPLWCNKHLYYNVRNKKELLFFNSWIEDGIVMVSDLRFIGGVLDDAYIYNKLKDRRNIFSEMSKVKEALKPFKNLLTEQQMVAQENLELQAVNGTSMHDFKKAKAKPFYKAILKDTLQTINITSFNNNFILNVDMQEFECLQKSRHSCTSDKKILEFNFKVIHNFLACNKSLVKWKKYNSELCSICDEQEDIIHVLFSCKCAKIIWSVFEDNTDFAITRKDIILGNSMMDKNIQLAILLLSYIIYKQWVKEKFNNVKRSVHSFLRQVKYDVKYKATVYRHIGAIELADLLDYIL